MENTVGRGQSHKTRTFFPLRRGHHQYSFLKRGFARQRIEEVHSQRVGLHEPHTPQGDIGEPGKSEKSSHPGSTCLRYGRAHKNLESQIEVKDDGASISSGLGTMSQLQPPAKTQRAPLFMP